MKKRDKKQMEVSAGSMADIAFLLLVFFFITTTIAQDKGLKMLLPPKKENRNELIFPDRNVLKILVNSHNELLVEEEPTKMENIVEIVKEFITNPENLVEFSSSPQEAIIAIKTARGTKYTTYIQVLDNVKQAYNELRAEDMGIDLENYLKFDKHKASEALLKQYEASQSNYPIRISEAEPDNL